MLNLRSDRGDILVTPAILVAAVATTLVLGTLTFFATRAVAPNVGGARQGLTLDDEGNIVGGVGVVPVATETPEPTVEPTQSPRVVTTHAPRAQTPRPTHTATVIVVRPTNNHRDDDDDHEKGEESTHNSGGEQKEDPHNQEPDQGH